MSAFKEPDECAICGNTIRYELRWSLVHWRDAAPGMGYEHAGTCADRPACRARVQAQGAIWPLAETSSERRAS